MKKLTLIILFIFGVSFAIGQPRRETIDIKVDKDVVIISDLDISANCGAKFTADIKIEDKKIIILQRDTSSVSMKCNCYFDLEHTIRELQMGSYTLEIYREEIAGPGNPYDTIQVADFTFEITVALTMPPVFFESKQSDCHDVDNVPEYNNNKDINIYPNPSNSNIQISFIANDVGYAVIKFYDILGNEIQSFTKENILRGENIINLSPMLPSGIYTCKLIFNDKIIKVSKVLLNK